MTRREWPDHNTHDIAADEQDLLTHKEAVIRLREELAEIDAQLVALKSVLAESPSEAQQAQRDKLLTRRALLDDGIARHNSRTESARW